MSSPPLPADDGALVAKLEWLARSLEGFEDAFRLVGNILTGEFREALSNAAQRLRAVGAEREKWQKYEAERYCCDCGGALAVPHPGVERQQEKDDA